MLRSSVKAHRVLACTILSGPLVALIGSVVYVLIGAGLLPYHAGAALRDVRSAGPLQRSSDLDRLRFARSSAPAGVSAVVQAFATGKGAMTEIDDVVPPPPLSPDVELLFAHKDDVPDSGKTNDLDLASLIAMVSGTDATQQAMLVWPPIATVSAVPPTSQQIFDDDRALHRELARMSIAHEPKRDHPPAATARSQK